MAPRKWTVLANEKQKKKQAFKSGKIIHSFKTTKLISSYLMAFAAGNYKSIDSKISYQGIKLKL